MSLGARATKGGAKGKDRNAQDKGKSDKPQPKEKVKPQATTEQLRMANMIDRKADDSADVRKMVKMVQDLMEMTCRTEEEVCSALHDSDNDVVAACNLLLEAEHTVTGEWQTSEKKKKKPPAAANNGEAEPPREPRSRSGPRPRRGEGERGGRGEGAGRGRGSGRGGRGGARGGRGGGGRGGRGGPRGRSDRGHEWSNQHSSDANPMGDTFPATEDWDNEEWSGSLSDTKVFTPSVNPHPSPDGDAPLPPAEEWEVPEPAAGSEAHIPTYTYHNPAAHHVPLELAAGSSPAAAPAPADPPLLPADTFLHHQHQQQHQHQHQPHTVQPMGMSGSLTAAQSQYLSQLTQQSQRHDNSVYTTNYGVYGSADITSQRKPQRARVPPPSKIPSSAVEMPGGAEGSTFLDVQFGALDELPDPPKPAANSITMPPQPPSPPAAPAPAAAPHEPDPAHHHHQHQHHQHQHQHQQHQQQQQQPQPQHYNNNMLNENLAVVESSAASVPPAAPEPVVTNASSSLEKQISASIKQLSVSDTTPTPPLHLPQHRHKPAVTVAAPAQTMYSHHPVTHPPPAVYSANVYAPQVNSSNASLSAGAGAAYPSSVTLTQYQPIINSYQTSSSAGAYSSSALYTAAAAPYSPYQPPSAKLQPKDGATHQYDTNAVASSNSLTSTSTTQTSTAKVTTTSGHGGAANSSGASYAGGALYGSQYYDEQVLRSAVPHHMGGYYEVAGYGVGVGVGVGGGARDAAFGLGQGERFGRTDAASPQQVPAAALPPGYAYYYQPPPPTTYQYGVYPNVSDLRVQFGAGSGVGGAAGGKVGSYQQQQPPQYEAQDSYKPGGGYTGNANKSGGAASADLTNAMYAKTHVTLNKVNSYEKAGFHSGTPPPFGAASHLYIAAPPLHHHHQPHHHQMDVRMNSSQNRRQESGVARAPANKAAHTKPAYTHSYWPTN